ncbi:DNA-directed RNA polymerase I subunit rpa49 [Entomophthora muscae]|uniref:DNA-directed RNA polymerase I subunit rpa49 n=1 Tax=Entomophthora muscae TaxID=34485 RepID=A0ACC2UG93_9FUNG|nr:DNA-directed RNA polymerase I subunit rpa49 [Entomophthora muscae]
MEGKTKEKHSKSKSKRPRNEDEAVKPKQAELNVKLEILDRPNLLAGPLLSQFKGRLNKTTTMIGFKHLKERRSKEKAPEYVIKGQTDTMAYQASSPLPVSNASQKQGDYKYLVGVYNKQQNQVALVEAPFFESQMRPVRLIDSDTFGRTTQIEYSDAKKGLDLAFGTRKKKSAIASMERNQVDYSLLTSSTSIIQKMVSDAKVVDAQEAEDDSSIGIEGLLPPHDSLTTLPDLIYPLNDMINPEILKTIQVTQLSKSSDSFEPKEFLAFGKSPFICSEIASSIASQTSHNASRVRLLVYVDWLIELVNKRRGEVYANPSALGKALASRGKSSISLAPVMARHICETYLEKGHGQAPGRQSIGTIYKLTSGATLKLHIHIIILLLHLTQFKLDVAIPSKAFSLDSSKTRLIMKGIGCRFKSAVSTEGDKSSKSTVGVLTAPLVIPEFHKPNGKRR